MAGRGCELRKKRAQAVATRCRDEQERRATSSGAAGELSDASQHDRIQQLVDARAPSISHEGHHMDHFVSPELALQAFAALVVGWLVYRLFASLNVTGGYVSRRHAAEEELMEAVTEGDAEAVRAHLASGVDVNCFDDEQSRPLHVAAFCGHTEVVKILLRAAADIEAKGQLDGTPLHVAATAGRMQAAVCLLDAAAEVDARDESELTPLHRAAQRGSAPMIQLLLSHDASIDATNEDRYTPLHVAALQGRTAAVEALLSAGASADAKTANGETALELARRADETSETATLLKRHAATKGSATPPPSPPASPPPVEEEEEEEEEAAPPPLLTSAPPSLPSTPAVSAASPPPPPAPAVTASSSSAVSLADLPHEMLVEIVCRPQGQVQVHIVDGHLDRRCVQVHVAELMLRLGSTCHALKALLLDDDELWRRFFDAKYEPLARRRLFSSSSSSGPSPHTTGRDGDGDNDDDENESGEDEERQAALAASMPSKGLPPPAKQPLSANPIVLQWKERFEICAFEKVQGQRLLLNATHPPYTWREFVFVFEAQWVDLVRVAGQRVLLAVKEHMYDVTHFVDEHPGDPALLVCANGRDATEAFDFVGHSSHAMRWMAKFATPDLDALGLAAIATAAQRRRLGRAARARRKRAASPTSDDESSSRLHGGASEVSKARHPAQDASRAAAPPPPGELRELDAEESATIWGRLNASAREWLAWLSPVESSGSWRRGQMAAMLE